MTRPGRRFSRVSTPTLVVAVLVFGLGIWVPLAFVLAVFLLFLGVPPLGVGLVVSIPPAILVLYAARRFRALRFARRHLHLALEEKSVNPGEVATGSLEVRLERPRVFRSLTARAWGGEEVSIRVGDSEGGGTTYSEKVPVLDESLVLEPVGANPWPSRGEGEVAVEPGRYRFRFSIQIPEGAPPASMIKRSALAPRTEWSTSGGTLTAQVRYFVRVRADIRGGLDAVREIEIPVGARGTPSDLPSARSARSSMQGEPGRPSVQLEIDHEEVEAGSLLRGSVSVTGLGDRRIQGVRIRLNEREWGKAKGREASNSKTLAKTKLSPGGGLGGLVAPFTLRLPKWVKPSYVGQIFSVRHIVRVRVRLAWARDLKVREEIRVVRGPLEGPL